MPFSKKLFGYDPDEVDDVVSKLTSDAMESAQNADRLAAELERQRSSITELRQDHDQLSHALVSAHKVAQEIRTAAEATAQTIIAEARERADAMVRGAEDAVRMIEQDIEALVKRRREAEESYAAFIESMVKAFESTRAGSKSSLTAFP